MRKLATLILFIIISGGYVFTQITTFPYNENFETQGQGPTGCGSAFVFTNGWTNDLGDDVDWVPDVLGTGSTNTGPTANGGADHNPGISGGVYIYIEASGCALDTANLVSPEIHVPSNMSNLFFEFWYHRWGADINVCIVQVQQITGGSPGPWISLDTLNQPNLDQWNQGLYDLSAYVGDTIKVRFRGVTGASFGSDFALDDISFYQILYNDAGVVSVDNPVNPVTPGINNVDVTIGSWGLDTLTQVGIQWEYDGLPQTPFGWTGSIGYGQTNGPVNIGTINFTPGLHSIKAWTSMPNLVSDSSNSNDTILVTLCSPLVGTYSLGGPGADFVDFTELGSILSSCGVEGHVIINVNPGVYNERLILDHVPGAADTATITIDGGNSSLVTLSGSQYSTIYLWGTDYVTVRNMTIENLGILDSYGVQLADTAEHNTIDSCVIVMNTTATNMSDVIGISASNTEASSFTEGQNALWTMVSNCQIIGGEKGIHFEGQAANRTEGNKFMYNLLDQQEDYGFYIDDQDSIWIIGNTITNLRTANVADGIYCFDLMMFDISYNNVVNAPDWGLYINDGNYNLDGIPTSRGRIINNMISSQTDYAIYLLEVEQTDMWHNTFFSNGGIRTCYFDNLINHSLKNNIFVNTTGLAFYSVDDLSLNGNTLDYNLYWVDGGAPTLAFHFGVNYVDLPTWKTAAPALNVNSIEVDPVFVGGGSDLHILSPMANDLGDNTVGIADDIDGDARPQLPSTIVDMGADEFTPVSDDALLSMLIEPTPTQCGDSITFVSVEVCNHGSDTITSMQVVVNVSGDITTTLSTTYTGPLAFNECDTVLVGILNTYAGGNVTFDGYVALVGDANTSNDTINPLGSSTFIPYEPVGINGYGCGTDSAWLYAESWPGVGYNWYASPTDTVPVAYADSFMVPSILSQSTYYLEYADNADSLQTTYVGGNGQAGNMFDLVALQSVNIKSFSGNLNAGTHATVNVYYKVGSYVGSETTPGNWTLIGTATNVVSIGNGSPTPIPVPVNITIPAGQTYSFYIDCSNSVAYTNGTTAGAVYVQNSYFQFLEGVGCAANFGGTFSPRIWNGTIHFGSDACSSVRVPVSAVSGTGATVITSGDSTLCDTMLTLNSTGTGSGSLVYSWSNGDMTPSTDVYTSGAYVIVVSDTNGCSATDTVNVTMYAPIYVDLGPDSLECAPATINLDAGNPGAMYTWSTSDTTQMIAVTTTGTYTVMVTDSNGCSATDSVNINIASAPVASFTATPTGTGLSYDFTDGSSDATSWSWDFGDGSGTSTLQNPSYTYGADGTYTVTLIVDGPCGSDTTTLVINVVGMLDAVSGNLMAYPNPNNGEFTVKATGLEGDIATLEVFNLYGQRVFENQSVVMNGIVKEKINLNDLPKGIYQVRLISAETVSIISITVQ